MKGRLGAALAGALALAASVPDAAQPAAPTPGRTPRGRRYYDPGSKPQPSRVRFGGRSNKPRRKSRAEKLALMRAAGIARPSGRQWRKLRKEMQRRARGGAR